MKVLIVEDDSATAQALKDGLTSNWHTVDIASDGAEGSFLGRSYEYDAILLDYSLPKKDGLAVCKEIRQSGRNAPIMFLSSEDDVSLKVKALQNGADDYMTKPYAIEELLARLQNLLSRPHSKKQGTFSIGDLTLNLDTHEVRRGDRQIRMTRKEFSLLEYLMRNTGVVLSRALIMEHVWSVESDPFSNTVEAHIRNVRKKICEGGEPDMITNVSGRGYVLNSPEKLNKNKTV